MTKSQVTYVVNTLLDDATDAITPLRKCAYFVMTKEEVKFNKHIQAHFYFDTTNELVRVMPYKIEMSLHMFVEFYFFFCHNKISTFS